MKKKYVIEKEEIEKLMDIWEFSKEMPNPYKVNGIYHSFVQSLINLGINKKHSFIKVKEEFRNILLNIFCKNGMNKWNIFVSNKKDIRHCKDQNGKIEDVAKSLQRIDGENPIGEKLKQMNSCIDILIGEKGLPYYRLNTLFKNQSEVKPINEFKNTVKRGRKKKSFFDGEAL